MIELFGLIPKRRAISHEQFHAHWATTHRELALQTAAGLARDADYTENAQRDEPNFIDIERRGVLMTRERVLRDVINGARARPNQFMRPPRRRAARDLAVT